MLRAYFNSENTMELGQYIKKLGKMTCEDVRGHINLIVWPTEHAEYIFGKNYLGKVKVLVEDMALHHPERRCTIEANRLIVH